MVEIRLCSKAHVPELVELWREYLVDQGDDPLFAHLDLDGSTEGFTRILEGYLKKEPGGFLVALEGQEVVGFAVSFGDAFGPNYVTRKKIGHIQAVHVKRSRRRKGVASRLVDASISYLRSRGCSIIIAEADEQNSASVGMLEKQGFRRRGRLVNYMKEV
jgi:ribosomal protein S18 acetylase RimI-like enzyme